MRAATIRHDPTAGAIVAYLAGHGRALRAARIVDYMVRMHPITRSAVTMALKRAVDRGALTRVMDGWYAVERSAG